MSAGPAPSRTSSGEAGPAVRSVSTGSGSHVTASRRRNPPASPGAPGCSLPSSQRPLSAATGGTRPRYRAVGPAASLARRHELAAALPSGEIPQVDPFRGLQSPRQSWGSPPWRASHGTPGRTVGPKPADPSWRAAVRKTNRLPPPQASSRRDRAKPAPAAGFPRSCRGLCSPRRWKKVRLAILGGTVGAARACCLVVRWFVGLAREQVFAACPQRREKRGRGRTDDRLRPAEPAPRQARACG